MSDILRLRSDQNKSTRKGQRVFKALKTFRGYRSHNLPTGKGQGMLKTFHSYREYPDPNSLQ